MIRRNPSGNLPVIDQSAFVDPTAILCGKVVVGANSNIQDGVAIHSDSDLDRIERDMLEFAEFSEDVARTNINLVQGYKKRQNEF